jgi:hypothetical protein
MFLFLHWSPRLLPWVIVCVSASLACLEVPSGCCCSSFCSYSTCSLFSYPGALFSLRSHSCSDIRYSLVFCSNFCLPLFSYPWFFVSLRCCNLFLFLSFARLSVTLGLCIAHSIPMLYIIMYSVYNRMNHRSKVIPDIPCVAKPSPCLFCCYTPTSLHKSHLWVLVLSNLKAMST